MSKQGKKYSADFKTKVVLELLGGKYYSQPTMQLLRENCGEEIFNRFMDDNSVCGTSEKYLSRILYEEPVNPLHEILFNGEFSNLAFSQLEKRLELIVAQRKAFLRSTYSARL